MKTINYQKFLLKTIKANYISFLLGILVVLFPIIFFSLKKITIQSFAKFFQKNTISAENVKPNNTIIFHSVKEGEDLWSISEKYFGSGHYAFQIASLNKLNEPYTLYLNQKILIPTIQPTIIEKGDILPNAASVQRKNTQILTYTVKEGEYLFQIAQNIYGDGNYMNKIIVANNIPYPFNIEVGQKLLIPPR